VKGKTELLNLLHTALWQQYSSTTYVPSHCSTIGTSIALIAEDSKKVGQPPRIRFPCSLTMSLHPPVRGSIQLKATASHHYWILHRTLCIRMNNERETAIRDLFSSMATMFCNELLALATWRYAGAAWSYRGAWLAADVS